eukprot:scaffold248408_cov103-Cyclotella_meneghiniana.AAC.1
MIDRFCLLTEEYSGLPSSVPPQTHVSPPVGSQGRLGFVSPAWRSDLSGGLRRQSRVYSSICLRHGDVVSSLFALLPV